MDRFEIMMLMRERHSDGVELAARTRTPERFEETVRFYTERTDPIFQLPRVFPLYDKTEEEDCADQIHGALEGIVIRHFVDQYSRDEMLTMLRLLNKASGRGDCAVEICRGLSLPLRDIAASWSHAHPDEQGIRYVGHDPDIG